MTSGRRPRYAGSRYLSLKVSAHSSTWASASMTVIVSSRRLGDARFLRSYQHSGRRPGTDRPAAHWLLPAGTCWARRTRAGYNAWQTAGRRAEEESVYHVGVDIGGTFTDCAVLDADGAIATIAKSPSSRRDPAVGVL